MWHFRRLNILQKPEAPKLSVSRKKIRAHQSCAVDVFRVSDVMDFIILFYRLK